MVELPRPAAGGCRAAFAASCATVTGHREESDERADCHRICAVVRRGVDLVVTDRRTLVILFLLIAASLAVGRAPLDVGSAIAQWMRGESTLATLVLIELRLPRTVLAVLVGASLGLAGAALQGLLRNPLAEPGIIGVSSCAALGAVIAFYSGASFAAPLALPLAGIAGAIVAVVLLYALAGREASTLTLILAGVAINGFAAAATALALNLAPNPFAVTEIVFWMMGSLADRSVNHLQLAAPLMIAGWALLLTSGRALDALTLGENRGKSGRAAWQTAIHARAWYCAGCRKRCRGDGCRRVCRTGSAAFVAPAGRTSTESTPMDQRCCGRSARFICGHCDPPDCNGSRAKAGRCHFADRRAVFLNSRAATTPRNNLMQITGDNITVMSVTQHCCITSACSRSRAHYLDWLAQTVQANPPCCECWQDCVTAQAAMFATTVNRWTLSRPQLSQRLAYLAQRGPVAWPLTVEHLVALGRLPHQMAWGRRDAQGATAIATALTRRTLAPARPYRRYAVGW